MVHRMLIVLNVIVELTLDTLVKLVNVRMNIDIGRDRY